MIDIPWNRRADCQYLSGYLVDDASEEEDVLQKANDLFSSLRRDRPANVQKLRA